MGGGKAEMGFDTNWIALFSRMYLPKDKQLTEVELVGSHPCKILPKSMILMENDDLIVSSYSAQGVKLRMFTTHPFCKISKGYRNNRAESFSQTNLATASGWTKDSGIQQFVELRHKWPLFKLYVESELTYGTCENDEAKERDEFNEAFFRFDRRFFYANQKFKEVNY